MAPQPVENLENQQGDFADQLLRGEAVQYRFLDYSPAINRVTISLLNQGLAQQQQDFLRNVILTFFKEIVNNALKANLKRAYFLKQKANISDPAAYQKLISSFKEEVLYRTEEYQPWLEKHDLHVNVGLHVTKDSFQITVSNNAPMTELENKRVRDRLNKIDEFQNLEEAFEAFSDQTEGAGLGIILNLMLLRNSGIGSGAFELSVGRGQTVTRLTIPRTLKLARRNEPTLQRIISLADGIPTFPESINRLVELCDDPQSQIHQVAKLIEKDPALTSDILRLANSGGFITVRKIASIHDAVTILGLKVIRQIALASAARKILNSEFKIYQGFWEHSFQCAFYARHLARKSRQKLALENIYLGGLLHDLGKIILFSVSPHLKDEIHESGLDRNQRSSSFLEEVALGISHAVVGGRVARKWNFSPSIVAMIEHHHSPFFAPRGDEAAVAAVHLADCLINVEKQRGKYYYSDRTAREALGFNSWRELESVHEEIRHKYEESSPEV